MSSLGSVTFSVMGLFYQKMAEVMYPRVGLSALRFAMLYENLFLLRPRGMSSSEELKSGGEDAW